MKDQQHCEPAAGSAPWFTIPHVPIVGVEHPCLITNVAKAVDTLGGPYGMGKVRRISLDFLMTHLTGLSSWVTYQQLWKPTCICILAIGTQSQLLLSTARPTISCLRSRSQNELAASVERTRTGIGKLFQKCLCLSRVCCQIQMTLNVSFGACEIILISINWRSSVQSNRRIVSEVRDQTPIGPCMC